MTFIIASLQLMLYFAWLVILMIGGYALALYIIGSIIELCVAWSAQGFKTLWHNPIRTLKDMHAGGVDTMLMRSRRFAMI